MGIKSIRTLKPGENPGYERPSILIPIRFDKSAPKSKTDETPKSAYRYLLSGKTTAELMKDIRTFQDISDALL